MKTTTTKTAWVRSKGRAYADSQNLRVKEYHKTAHGKLALRVSGSNARAKSYKGEADKLLSQDLLDLWLKQMGLDISLCKCSECGELQPWELDHIVELKDGGTHAISNIQLLCPSCHSKKTASSKSGRIDWDAPLLQRQEQRELRLFANLDESLLSYNKSISSPE